MFLKNERIDDRGGLDVKGQFTRLTTQVRKLQKAGIRVSLFIDPDLEQVESSAELGADAVEFHTGTWVLSRGREEKVEWARLKEACSLAHERGLHVHAGHGLDYDTTRKAMTLPFLEEVNIGHSLVCYALEIGLKNAVSRMKKVLR